MLSEPNLCPILRRLGIFPRIHSHSSLRRPYKLLRQPLPVRRNLPAVKLAHRELEKLPDIAHVRGLLRAEVVLIGLAMVLPCLELEEEQRKERHQREVAALFLAHDALAGDGGDVHHAWEEDVDFAGTP
uniref:Uncharacterized protein n=1 Tax=Mycena chlorophos TaxID=658473 RepID=A0ABQ0L470_MYCCL|nr:predicted protein [Mycena chlorophos]